jgi:Peptidase family M23
MRRLTLQLAPTLLVFLLLVPPASADWVWPVRGEVITPYRNGTDPYASGQHRGVDIAAATGTPVVAAAGGEVRFAGTAGSSGLTVSVRTADGRYDTSYLHLSETSVREGDSVAAGQRLGAVGSTGSRSATEPHLHFGVRDAGSRHAYHDPLGFLPPPTATEPPRGAPAPEPAPVPVGRAPAPAPVHAPATRRIPVRRPVPVGEPRRVPAGEPRRVPVGSPRRVPVGEPRRAPVGEPRRVPEGAPWRVPVGDPRRVPLGEPGRVPLGEPRRVSLGHPGGAPVGERRRVPAGERGRVRVGDPRPALAGEPQRTPGLQPDRPPAPGGAPLPPNAPDPTRRPTSSSGPDLGLLVACLGLLAAAAVLGLTGDGRKTPRETRRRIARALKPMPDRR